MYLFVRMIETDKVTQSAIHNATASRGDPMVVVCSAMALFRVVCLLESLLEATWYYRVLSLPSTYVE